MNLKAFAAIFSILALGFGATALRADVVQPSAYQLFGISAGFNNVFFGDYTGISGDIEGHAAIQGNVNVQSYSFGAYRQERHQDGPVLVVGGNVKASGTDVYDGNAYIGGKLESQTGSMWNALGAKGQGFTDDPSYQASAGTIYVNDASTLLTYGPDYHQSFAQAGISSIPFDFTVAQNELRAVSSQLWGLSNTATGAYDESGNYIIDLTGQTGLQTVTVDAAVFALLESTNRNLFVSADADTTLVINVTDETGLDLLNLGQDIYINGQNSFFEGDFDGSNILINTDVAKVTVLSSEINASLLALDAHIDVRLGHITGQVFASSAYTEQGGEFHAYYVFDDKHFGAATTPEPATLLIFGMGLAPLAWRLRNGKSRRRSSIGG